MLAARSRLARTIVPNSYAHHILRPCRPFRPVTSGLIAAVTVLSPQPLPIRE